MLYTKSEVIDLVANNDIKFIRMAFCDVFGNQKNISIMPSELEKAFESGISFDASAISGFADVAHSDLFLFPDPSTMTLLPWRPSHGRVVRFMCSIKYPDGTPFELDSRRILKKNIEYCRERGLVCNFGSECEFYLFKTDEFGRPTTEPFDHAGYMDIAPEDKGENVRREICLTLEEMGINPERSHHEQGPGQNEIDFHYSDAMTAADNVQTFKMVVRTIASRNGLCATFSPKPIEGQSGNGHHINISIARNGMDQKIKDSFIAGILEHIREMTAFLNPSSESYKRLGSHKAPLYISWSEQNRSQLVRIPAAGEENARIELRSPDNEANIYLAYALILRAGLDGIERKLSLCRAHDIDLYTASEDEKADCSKLPVSFEEAISVAKNSEFISQVLPKAIVDAYDEREREANA